MPESLDAANKKLTSVAEEEVFFKNHNKKRVSTKKVCRVKILSRQDMYELQGMSS